MTLYPPSGLGLQWPFTPAILDYYGSPCQRWRSLRVDPFLLICHWVCHLLGILRTASARRPCFASLGRGGGCCHTCIHWKRSHWKSMIGQIQTHSWAMAPDPYDCRDQSSIKLSLPVLFSVGNFCCVMRPREVSFVRSATVSYCFLVVVLSSNLRKLKFHCARLSRHFLKSRRCSAVLDWPLICLSMRFH